MCTHVCIVVRYVVWGLTALYWPYYYPLRACVHSGLFSVALRYNVRGCGGSGGSIAWGAATDAKVGFRLMPVTCPGRGGEQWGEVVCGGGAGGSG